MEFSKREQAALDKLRGMTSNKYNADSSTARQYFNRLAKSTKSPALCEAVLQLSGLFLEGVPHEHVNRYLCLKAVEKDGIAICYVPWELRDTDLCLVAVKNDIRAIEYIDDECITAKTIEAYAEHSERDIGNYFRFIPEKLMTEALCIKGLKCNSKIFDIIPEHLRTETVCAQAARDFKVFIEMDNKYKTRAVCLNANKVKRECWDSIPSEHLDENFYLACVTDGREQLKFVPKAFQTDAVIEAAIKKYAISVKYIHSDLAKESHYILSAQMGRAPQSGDAFLTEKVAHAAVMHKGMNLRVIPDRLKTQALCELAVQGAGMALEGVPDELRTEDLCIRAIMLDSYANRFLPERLNGLDFKLKLMARAKSNGYKCIDLLANITVEEIDLFNPAPALSLIKEITESGLPATEELKQSIVEILMKFLINEPELTHEDVDVVDTIMDSVQGFPQDTTVLSKQWVKLKTKQMKHNDQIIEEFAQKMKAANVPLSDVQAIFDRVYKETLDRKVTMMDMHI